MSLINHEQAGKRPRFYISVQPETGAKIQQIFDLRVARARTMAAWHVIRVLFGLMDANLAGAVTGAAKRIARNFTN